jgi:hypothetical protein
MFRTYFIRALAPRPIKQEARIIPMMRREFRTRETVKRMSI